MKTCKNSASFGLKVTDQRPFFVHCLTWAPSHNSVMMANFVGGLLHPCVTLNLRCTLGPLTSASKKSTIAWLCRKINFEKFRIKIWNGNFKSGKIKLGETYNFSLFQVTVSSSPARENYLLCGWLRSAKNFRLSYNAT